MKVQVIWPDKRLVDAEIIIGWATDILMDEAYKGQCACDSGFPCGPCQRARPSTPPTLPEALFIVNDRGAATTVVLESHVRRDSESRSIEWRTNQ